MGALKLQERKQLQVAELTIAETQIKLPILYGTEGEKALDISKLRSETGFVTLDPAYMNTASCTSEITFLEGEKGILPYRGYPL